MLTSPKPPSVLELFTPQKESQEPVWPKAPAGLDYTLNGGKVNLQPTQLRGLYFCTLHHETATQ